MKIDFRNIEVEVDFDGRKETIDVSKQLANYAKMKTSDIAFEDFCREIYYKGEVEVDNNNRLSLLSIVSDSSFLAPIKRELINKLNQAV